MNLIKKIKSAGNKLINVGLASSFLFLIGCANTNFEEVFGTALEFGTMLNPKLSGKEMFFGGVGGRILRQEGEREYQQEEADRQIREFQREINIPNYPIGTRVDAETVIFVKEGKDLWNYYDKKTGRKISEWGTLTDRRVYRYLNTPE